MVDLPSFLRKAGCWVLQKTGEEGELSCGWATLPLFEADGKPVISK